MSKAGKHTRQRILTAACELFSVNGYHDVTHQEICHKAKANCALINYHYNSKDNLYRAVLDTTFQSMESKWLQPLKGDPEETLRSLARNRMAAAFDKSASGYFFKILYHEMTWPTPLNDYVKTVYIKKLQGLFASAVRTFLGDEAEQDDVECVMHSILGSSVLLTLFKQHQQGIFQAGEPSGKRAEKVVQTLTDIAMSGARGVRSKYMHLEEAES